ncbi:hypothetical protein HOY82DRAFT_562827 [Tuber indicum]|nr:hypothetical protein HOY82DRAFT_562827 [Tuber indicum]
MVLTRRSANSSSSAGFLQPNSRNLFRKFHIRKAVFLCAHMGGPTLAISYKALKTTAATMLAVQAQSASFPFGSCGLASASFRFLHFASAFGGLTSAGSLPLFFCLAFG